MATRAPSFRPSSQGVLDVRTSIREQAAAKREDYEETRRPIREYAELVPTGAGVALDLDPEGDWAFQIEPFYSDEVARAREVVYKKSTQVGASEGTWRWAVRECDQYGRTTIYTFPTDKHVTDFGDERIEPAIESSEYLRGKIPPGYVKHKHLKRIGRGWLYLRGAKSRVGAQSVAGGSLVFDEYDELEPRIVAQFERRLSGAKQRGLSPRLRRLGIPTTPGFGIDALYEDSDQREWHVTCPECEHEQTISFAENLRWTMPPEYEEESGRVYRAGHDHKGALRREVDPKVVAEAWRACSQCEASLEGKPIRRGRWIALNPGAEVIGFYVHRLIVPNTDLQELVRNSRKTAPYDVEAFHNNDLGLAYSPSDAQLTDEDIQAAGSDVDSIEPAASYRGPNPVVAGLDVASERNQSYWIDELMPDGRSRQLAAGELTDIGAMVPLMEAFNIAMLVIDGMPDRQSARELARLYPGRVVLAAYDDPGFNPRLQPDAISFNPKKNLVTLNRTEAIDATFDGIRRLTRVLLRVRPPGFDAQLKAPKRVRETDDQERERRVYRKPQSMADDYTHAGVYALAAKTLWQMKVHAEQRLKARRGRPVRDRDLGIRRGRLDGYSDDYDPGMGEGR